MSRRTDRVESFLKREISELILKELGDPRLQFITITDVNVSPDIKLARVYYSVLGSEWEKKEDAVLLEKVAVVVRRLLARRLNMRTTPRISFIFDSSIERGARIEKILDTLPDKERENV